MWRYLKIALVSIVLISVLVFIVLTDFNLVLDQIAAIGLGFAWIFLASCGAYYFGALAWKYCFSDQKNISIWRLFLIRTVGENITIINPTNVIAGEVSKLHLLKDSPIGFYEQLDSILVSRIIMIASQLSLSFICLVWFVIYTDIGFSVLHILFLVLGLGCITYLAFIMIKRSDILNKSRFLKYYWIKFIRLQKRIFSFFKTNKINALKAFLFTSIHWLFGALEIFIILLLLGLTPSFMMAVVFDMGIVIIKSIGGFVPAQLGVEEMGNKLMLGLTGVKVAGLWLSVSILRRTKQLCWIGISFIFYSCIKISSPSKQKQNGHLIYKL